MLLPCDTRHNPESVILRDIEQPARRWRVGSHGVDTVGCHGSEIGSNDSGLRELVTRSVRTKGSISHSLDPELAVTLVEKFSLYRDPVVIQGSRLHRRQSGMVRHYVVRRYCILQDGIFHFFCCYTC